MNVRELGLKHSDNLWRLSTPYLWNPSTNKSVIAWHFDQAELGKGTRPRSVPLEVSVDGVHEVYAPYPKMGTDPEFFVARGGSIVPAFNVLPHKSETDGGPFWDGFQGETTVEQQHCHACIVRNLAKRFLKLQEQGLQVLARGAWRLPAELLQHSSDAQVALGCDASHNAYGLHGQLHEDPRLKIWRFTGGHLHFELDQDERHRDYIRHLVKMLDLGLGVPCVALAQNFDNRLRRRDYGLPGEFRLPDHGLEYRTLSNFWVMDPRVMMLVLDLARHVLNLARSQLRGVLVGDERRVRDTILYTDVRSAKDFMKLNREWYGHWARFTYGSDQAFWEAIKAGVDRVVPKWGQDVLQAWQMPAAMDDWNKVPTWKSLS